MNILVFLSLSSFFWAPTQSTEAPVPKHLTEARELVRQLSLSNTKYEHGQGEVKWKDPPKAYCDCSGLINHLLMHTYSYTEDDLKNWTGSRRPTARRYHDLIDLGQSKNWKKIEKLENLKPGDLIAIKYLDAKEGDNTGHVMLVDAKPKLLNTPTETIAGAAKQWEVPVIDSTMSPHGKKDSRYDKNEKHTGVGQGTFRILTDDQGTIVGYTWSLDSSKTIYKQNVHHMLFGRLER